MFDPSVHWYEVGIAISLTIMIAVLVISCIHEWYNFFCCVANNTKYYSAIDNREYDFIELLKCTLAFLVFGGVAVLLASIVWPVAIPILFLIVINEIAKAIGRKRENEKLDLTKKDR